MADSVDSGPTADKMRGLGPSVGERIAVDGLQYECVEKKAKWSTVGYHSGWRTEQLWLVAYPKDAPPPPLEHPVPGGAGD